MKVRFLFSILLLYGFSAAATYYIDFEGGSDAADGTSEAAAWKHAPGDASAEGNPASVSLTGGDIILFKGGVTYYGKIYIDASGTAGNPITYKGNGWGDEKAVIDGSKTLAGSWTQCTSADQLRGNADYAHIWFTDAPASGYGYETGTWEGSSFIWASREPEAADPFHGERRDALRMIPLDDAAVHQTNTTVTDPRYFTATDPDFYEGSYVALWHNPNVTHNYKILSYDPSTHTITHEPVDAGGGNVYDDRDTYYAIVNHPAYISRAGDFFYDETAGRLYVRPLAGTDPPSLEYGYDQGGCGIYANGKSNLVIEGFIVQKFTQGIRCINGDASHTVIRHNWVRSLKSNDSYAVQVAGTNMYVDSNRVEDCHRGVGILMSGFNTYARYNTVIRTSRQGIWAMGNEHCVIADNELDDLNGTHCNGISVYLYNKDVLVARNRVLNSLLPLTWHGDRDPELYVNLTIFGNVCEGKGQCWGSEMHGTTAINNTFTGGFFTADSDDSVVNVNNIQHAGGTGDIARTHNVYTSFGWWQSSKYGWYVDPSEVDYTAGDLTTLYADTAADDYSILESSVAHNAGTDPTAYLPIDLFPEFDFTKDINGNTFGEDGTWDIGAFEYKASPVVDYRKNLNRAASLLPNPLPVSQLHLVNNIRNISGNATDKISSGGIYLVQPKGTDLWQRVIVIQ